jgi:threonine dehydrogenase-like Zn-dependent dehydrogenase
LLATQRGYQTYVLDRVTEGRKPEMVRRLGATYVPSGDLGEAAAEADIIIECTGYVQMLLEAGPRNVRHRITCLTGVSAAGSEAAVDPGLLNRNMVLQNSVIFGSVNANRHHYELAAKALAEADPGWLADLLTRQVPLDRWDDAYTRKPDDIKTHPELPGRITRVVTTSPLDCLHGLNSRGGAPVATCCAAEDRSGAAGLTRTLSA